MRKQRTLVNHQDVGIKENAHYSLTHFVNNPNVRTSMSDGDNLSLSACSRCASVSLSHADCGSHSGVAVACSLSHLTCSDSGILYLARMMSTIFSSFDISCLTSWRNISTVSMSCRLIPLISPSYGASGVSWIVLAAVLIISKRFDSCGKVTTII